MQDMIDAGCRILVCPPCTKVRGCKEENLIDAMGLAGSAAMLGVVSDGASTVTFLWQEASSTLRGHHA